MNYYFDIELTPQRDESDVVKTIKVKVNRWTNGGEMTQTGSTYVSNSGLKALWKETNKEPLIGSEEFMPDDMKGAPEIAVPAELAAKGQFIDTDDIEERGGGFGCTPP